MKRIIPAIIILLILVGGYLGSYVYINNVCDTATEGIEACLKEYEAHGTAKADADWLKNYWDENEKILSFFVNHELIDRVEMSITNIKLHSAFKENYMFYDACDTAKTLLHQIMEDTKISAHSVF
ncbi:MAG: DUF4363 family protein [Clostridia bacterium]|nr:DUF4363 family protein [Clostridia bacterium]